MEYIACPAGQRGGGHVAFDYYGAQTVATYMNLVLLKMESGDNKFILDWHVSRSSRNKARFLAEARLAGQPVQYSAATRKLGKTSVSR